MATTGTPIPTDMDHALATAQGLGPIPARDVTQPATHATVTALMRARRDWWLALAATYCDSAERFSFDSDLVSDFLAHARRCLTAATWHTRTTTTA